MAVDLNGLVGSVASIASADGIDGKSINVEFVATMDMLRGTDAVRKIDEKLRRQSHKLVDKLRRIRHASKSGQDGERKVSAASNPASDDKENQVFLFAKRITDSTVRRQSAFASPRELAPLANGQFKPKVSVDRRAFGCLSCRSLLQGILRSSSKTGSDVTLSRDALVEHFSSDFVRGEKNLDKQLSIDSQSSNPSASPDSSKRVKRVTFSVDTLAQ